MAKGAVDKAIAGEEDQGLQLAQWVAKFSSVPSRNKAKTVIASGKVKLNGEWMGAGDAGRAISCGDEAEILWSRPGTSKPHAKAHRELLSQGLDILYEDPYIVALNKPAGLLTDSATKQQEKERATARKLMNSYLKPQEKRPVVVHRIDRDTSGIVLFAKDPQSAETIREGFREQLLDRFYWVAVQGGPTEDEGVWENWVYWDSKHNVLRRGMPEQSGVKLASAKFRVVERFPRLSILEVELGTGKRNQIRFQCQERNYPLCGEKLYLPAGWDRKGFPCPRQALHAKKLVLSHPRTNRKVVIECPLPSDLSTWLERAKTLSEHPLSTP